MSNNTTQEMLGSSAPVSTILLAEDDPDDRELMQEAFSKLDNSYYLHMVPDGRSVLNYLGSVPDEQLPCLIVLDYNMPNLNGAEVLENLCMEQRFRNIPKIILSTSNASKDMKECLRKGASAYKVKPANFTELLQIAKEMLEFCKDAA